MNDNDALPLWKREFPDFDGIDFEIPEGFVDVSSREQGRPTFVNEDLGLTLEVDSVDPARRQFADASRFYLLQEEDERCGSADPLLAESDDFADILSEIEAYAAEMRPAMRRS